jgi:hypothetical protein
MADVASDVTIGSWRSTYSPLTGCPVSMHEL